MRDHFPDLISQKEACRRLGISVRGMFRRRRAGDIGYYDFDGTIKFDAREIEHYKRKHRVGPPLPLRLPPASSPPDGEAENHEGDAP